ncbi:unnamed protein product [Enterobius vermicularis]|uniref:Tafazzin family protein n=1 Tax=Enterobius vermicularis TaxID=51028 RepID=A0A0N4V8V7_ENTVE|nr:unnamed protein product [Enterobius vermicularis]
MEDDLRLKCGWPFPRNPSILYRIGSYAVMTLVLSGSKLLFSFGLNRMTVTDKQRLLDVLGNRSRPLITVGNHRTTMDDPLIWSMFSWKEFFANISRFRYTLAAHNICFTKALHTHFFALGKCVPIIRGAGVRQKGMEFCLEKLSKNAWVHIYPEGKVTPEPLRIKWGVARLVIMDCPKPPLVLPIWVQRMADVWPPFPPYYPRFRKQVTVTVGEVIDMKKHLPLLNGSSELESRKAIADFIQQKLYDLGEIVRKGQNK